MFRVLYFATYLVTYIACSHTYGVCFVAGGLMPGSALFFFSTLQCMRFGLRLGIVVLGPWFCPVSLSLAWVVGCEVGVGGW